MTRQEFNGWTRDLTVRIPSLGQHIASLGTARETLDCWFSDVFLELELRDCMAVTHMLMVGDVEKPYPSDIPSFYRREVRQLAFLRAECAERTRLKKSKSSGGAWSIVSSGSMRSAFRHACKIIRDERAAGKSLTEAIDEMKFSRRQEWASLV